MENRRLVFRVHAIQRMFERGIGVRDVRMVLESGVTIESYPHDDPYPSRLVLGRVDSRPIHVVAADDPEGATTMVITVYEPDAARWDASFRRRADS
ncbi:MAG: DUF4258 domain-containing protein [Phycisphaerales bacterium]|nr:DUF4258 domain-containing protein [Phycisphaerales bacterium]